MTRQTADGAGPRHGAVAMRALLIAALAALAIWCFVEAADRVEAERWSRAGDAAVRHVAEDGLPVRASYAWYTAFADRALLLDPPAYTAAEAALERALARDSRDGEAWAKLAHIRLQQHGAADGGAIAALQQSYLRMPYAGWHFRRWRLALADSMWPDLPEPLQQAVLREARIAPQIWLRGSLPRMHARLTTSC